MVHAFGDRERKDAVRALARDVGAMEARVADLEARCKRLEEAGDALQSAVVGTEGMTHWQWLAAAHEADLRWRKAKESKP